MKPLLKVTIAISAVLLMTGFISAHAQDAAASAAITKAIHQYYEAMAARDVEALRGVLDSTFIVVQAGDEHAKTHVINASDAASLLPPERNDDWQNLEVTDLKVSVSGTHPSVATVSYTVFHPLRPDQIEMIEESMKSPRWSQLDDSARRRGERLLADKGGTESERGGNGVASKELIPLKNPSSNF